MTSPSPDNGLLVALNDGRIHRHFDLSGRPSYFLYGNPDRNVSQEIRALVPDIDTLEIPPLHGRGVSYTISTELLSALVYMANSVGHHHRRHAMWDQDGSPCLRCQSLDEARALIDYPCRSCAECHPDVAAEEDA